jgi:hypothetical protein
MRIVAGLLSAWAGLRWVGVGAGAVRAFAFAGPVRREALRACITRGATTVWISVGALYAWAQALRLQPRAELVGFLAACLMCSLAAGVAASFMQPEWRTPQTLGVAHVRWRRAGDEDEGDGGEGDHGATS